MPSTKDRSPTSEAIKNAILETALDCIVTIDAHSRIVEFNAVAERVFGYTRAEVIGADMAELIMPPEFRKRHHQGLARYLKTGEAHVLGKRIEITAMRSDGSHFPVELAISRIEAAGKTLFTAQLRDITERKRAEAALVETNARILALAGEREATLGQLAEGVIVTDATGQITLVNKAAEELHGVKMLGGAPDDYSDSYRLLTEDGDPYPPRELPLARAVLNGETVLDARWRIRRPDGSEIMAIGSARPIFDAAGERIGAVLTLRDDTARLAAETALRDLNATLEQRVTEEIAERAKAEEQLRQAQKMETIGHLTGGVAHDFNNLLTVIIGNIESFQRHLPAGAPDRLRRSAENAMQGARRATMLTQRLLAFSRRQPLEPKPVDVNKLVSGMSDMLGRTLSESIELQTVLAGGLWRVEIDPNQLESSLLNLAVNARDAMPSGGRLTIETANAYLDEGYSARETEVLPGQYVLLAVSDTGGGMSKEVLERVFEPFFTTKQTGHGTGLGLSQVYGFVKQSGGHVKIYSELREGTTVKIYLPRFVGALAEDDAALVTVPDGHPAETVLVVEDDDDVRLYSADILRELGYRVIEARDGTEALRHLALGERLDLLFTDVGLPGMNGRELFEEARKLRPSLKVLFTTGYARNAIVHHGRLDPGVQMIGKPFNYADLAAKVRSVIDGNA